MIDLQNINFSLAHLSTNINKMKKIKFFHEILESELPLKITVMMDVKEKEFLITTIGIGNLTGAGMLMGNFPDEKNVRLYIKTKEKTGYDKRVKYYKRI